MALVAQKLCGRRPGDQGHRFLIGFSNEAKSSSGAMPPAKSHSNDAISRDLASSRICARFIVLPGVVSIVRYTYGQGLRHF